MTWPEFLAAMSTVAFAALVLLVCLDVRITRDRRRAVSGVDAHADVAMAMLSPDDDTLPAGGCGCEDCADMADGFAAIAEANPDLRIVERAVADLYLVPDDRPQGSDHG